MKGRGCPLARLRHIAVGPAAVLLLLLHARVSGAQAGGVPQPPPPAPQAADITPVYTVEQLRSALLSGVARISVLAPMRFNASNWPDPPVTVSTPISVSSPYRAILDFCDAACNSGAEPVRPLINVTSGGSLLLTRVFLRNFLPSAPQLLTGLGPVPALLASGSGLISFKLVVFHFSPHAAWALADPPGSVAADSFWAREGRRALSEVNTGAPPSLERPDLYAVKYPGRDYAIDTCYAMLDLAGCYGGEQAGGDEPCDADDTTLVYCPYTLADSLRNPYVRRVRVFHDVGIDRIAYNHLNPIVVTRPITYCACPGAPPATVNIDSVLNGVVVRSQVAFEGLSFKGSTAAAITSWPPAVPLLLSLFSVQGDGRVALRNGSVEVDDLPGLARAVAELPGCCSPDPLRPDLQPRLAPSSASLAALAGMTAAGAAAGAPPPELFIGDWLLFKTKYLQYAEASSNTLGLGTENSAAAWDFEDVRVVQGASRASPVLCYAAAQEQGGMRPDSVKLVANDAQLRDALADPNSRYVQVVADIKLDPARWAGGVEPLLVQAAIMEVRACHPMPGSRYVVDLSELDSVVRVAGRLLWQGDLMFVGLGWASALASAPDDPDDAPVVDFAPLGAFHVVNNRLGASGCMEMEGVVIQGQLPQGQSVGATSRVAVLSLLGLGPSLPPSLTFNATLQPNGAMLSTYWYYCSRSQNGAWSFINTQLRWDAAGAQTAAQEVSGGDTITVPVAAIAVPSAVGGALLLAALAGGAWVLWRRSSRNRAAGKPGGCAGAACHHSSASTSFEDFEAAGVGGPAGKAAAAVAGNGSGRRGSKEGDAAGAPAAPTSASTSCSPPLATIREHAEYGSLGGPGASGRGGRPADSSGVAVQLTEVGAGAAAGSGCGADQAAGNNHDGSMSRASRRSTPSDDIDALRRAIASRRLGGHSGLGCVGCGDGEGEEEIVLVAVLGEGSYGRVYRATWRGTEVAVKVIHLPSHMSNRERREKMAVMETAISSSLSHPNIVQTFTYSVQRVAPTKEHAGSRLAGAPLWLRDQTQQGDEGDASSVAEGGAGAVLADGPGPSGNSGGGGLGGQSWEVRLVQEYCELGSLRDKLNEKIFVTKGGQLDMASMLDTAIDIARAVAHLHREGIVHADLKPRNVLLQGSTREQRGFVAKVADFGLSLKLDTHETHISNAYQGTLTYMAPETLMQGRVGRACDVYAFGIMLWELYTSKPAYQGVPRALLGHAITKDNKRPEFPPDAPFDYQLLAMRCWESNPDIRPSFESILDELKRMRTRLANTQPLGPTSYCSQWGLPPLQPHAPSSSLSLGTTTGYTAATGATAPSTLHQHHQLRAGAGAMAMMPSMALWNGMLPPQAIGASASMDCSTATGTTGPAQHHHAPGGIYGVARTGAYFAATGAGAGPMHTAAMEEAGCEGSGGGNTVSEAEARGAHAAVQVGGGEGTDPSVGVETLTSVAAP